MKEYEGIVNYPEYEECNKKMFHLYGTTLNDIKYYNCVCCSKGVSIDDSYSLQGEHLMCVACVDEKFGRLEGHAKMYEYFTSQE